MCGQISLYVLINNLFNVNIQLDFGIAAKDSEQRAATRSPLLKCFALPKDFAKDPNVTAVMV